MQLVDLESCVCAENDYKKKKKKWLLHLKPQRRERGNSPVFPPSGESQVGEGKSRKGTRCKYCAIIFKVQKISTSKAQHCILLITFIVSLVLLPVISAYLLVSSLLPHAPLAYTDLALAFPFPPSAHASQAPMPMTPHPVHSLYFFHLICCHLLLYLFQFCLPLLGSPPHLHHCLPSFCPIFLFIISSLSFAASSPHFLLTLQSYLSLHCPISPSVPLPYSLQCLSPQHCTISFYCFMCCFPVPLLPSRMVP